MSPELLDPEIQDRRHTTRSDCYALGMVMYEVLSGRAPFYRYKNNQSFVIPGKVIAGDRPERPQGAEGAWFTDYVWETVERCWKPQPRDRPNIEVVLQCLEGVSKSWIPPSPRSSIVPSTADSLTHGSSYTITMESTDGSGASSLLSVAPPQPLEKLCLEGSAGIANGVSRTSLDEFQY